MTGPKVHGVKPVRRRADPGYVLTRIRSDHSFHVYRGEGTRKHNKFEVWLLKRLYPKPPETIRVLLYIGQKDRNGGP